MREVVIAVVLIGATAGCVAPPTVEMSPVIRILGPAGPLPKAAFSATPLPGTLVMKAAEPTGGPHLKALTTGGRLFQWRQLAPISASSNAEAWENTYAALRDEVVRRGVRANGYTFSTAEPSVQFLDGGPTDTAAAPRSQRPHNDAEVIVSEPAARAWPNGSWIGWHLDEGCSQLQTALDLTESYGRQHPADFHPARVAIIDTDFDLTVNPMLNSVHLAACGVLEVADHTGVGGGPTHGSGTLSLLAGQRVRVLPYPADDAHAYIHGANPHAVMIPIKGASGVAQVFSVLSIVEGLEMAADNGAEIVSLSNGGWPSDQEADALNVAYHRGVAVFAASGDYLACPFLPLTTPSFVVYPAAYPNCVCVPGITATFKSYAYPNSWWGWLTDLSHWKMRGNSGPTWSMRRAVCGYSPNVPWATMDQASVSLAGQGTSASTPQVAGAASLWLEVHRHEISDAGAIGTWRQAELVMNAVCQGAVQPPGAHPDSNGVDFDFGRGRLQAATTLMLRADQIRIPDEPREAQYAADWLTVLLSIAYPRPAMLLQARGLTARNAARVTVEAAVRDTFFPARSSLLLTASPTDQSLVPALVQALDLESEQALARSKAWRELVAAYHGGTEAEFDARLRQLTPRDARSALERLLRRDVSRSLHAVVTAAQARAER